MHTSQFRVYYEDTDAGGVVYYANYLKFAERARTEVLRSAGLEQSELLAKEGLAFVVRKVEAEFLKPARLDDLLTITTRLHDNPKATLTMQQTVSKGSTPLVELTVHIAVVKDFKPVRLPAFVREALMNTLQ